MPLLHGEGHPAFLRLQEEIMKRSHDQSLADWGYNPLSTNFWGNPSGDPVWAQSPAEFAGSKVLQSHEDKKICHNFFSQWLQTDGTYWYYSQSDILRHARVVSRTGGPCFELVYSTMIVGLGSSFPLQRNNK
ncbi:hypothetical protein F5X99DRAFT_152889 [Biscogniauxia marginata]|nr:hypothetical protein F5X99DRAFT_152889 [Biscogniauxia marginata]